MSAKGVFISGSGQVRAGWRILLAAVFFFFAANVLNTIPILIYMFSNLNRLSGVNPGNFGDLMLKITYGYSASPIFVLITSLLGGVSMFGAILLVLRLFERKSLKDLGLTSFAAGTGNLAKGLVLGAVSMTLIFAFLISSGNISLVNSLSSPNIGIGIITGLAAYVMVGIYEELFARGYCLTVLKQEKRPWFAPVVSSVIFALMHIMNPNLSLLAMLNLFLVGLLFAFMTVRSGSLWMAIGYHTTWNYFQGYIFGFPVSGTAPAGIYNLKLTVPDILNGGGFGPEGGFASTAAIILGFITVHLLFRRKDRVS